MLAERNRADGTLALLRTGVSVLAVGILCVAAIYSGMGGIGPHGPTGNFAWLLLMIALMCLPFGLFLTVLGGAEWLRNRSESS